MSSNNHLEVGQPTSKTIEKIYFRRNKAPSIKNQIQQEIRRSRLRNKFMDLKTDAERTAAFNKQHNYCVSLILREKKIYFSNLKISDGTDNKTFWIKVKPLFPEKVNFQTKITLAEIKGKLQVEPKFLQKSRK